MNSRKVSEKKQQDEYSLEIAKIKSQAFYTQINMYLSKALVLKEKYLNKDTDKKEEAACEKDIAEINAKIIDAQKKFGDYCGEFTKRLPSAITIGGKKYEFVWCTNTNIQIQDRYSSVDEWFMQVATLTPSAVLDGALVMINEGIAIYNEGIAIYNKKHPEKPKELRESMDEKTIGRLSFENIARPVLKMALEAKAESGKML